jgi:hypothetical protein
MRVSVASTSHPDDPPRQTPMRRLVLPLLALLAIALAVAGVAHLIVASSRHAEAPGAAPANASETQPLPPFSRVDVDGMVDVTLVQGAEEAVTIEAPARQSRRIRTGVRDGTLTIEAAGSDDWFGGVFAGGGKPAHILVNFRALERVRASGAVKVRADHMKADALAIALNGASSIAIGQLDAKSLAVSGSGAMKAQIAGHGAEQTIDISGAGSYRAPDFVTDAATVSVSGAGKAVVNAARTLDVRISGAGVVDYLGNPKVREEVSGVGRVRRRDSASAARALAG